MASPSAQKRNRRHAASLTAKQEQAKDVSVQIRVNRMWKDAVLSQNAGHAQVTKNPTSISFMTCNMFWRKRTYLVHFTMLDTRF
jgi:hypothetical protein